MFFLTFESMKKWIPFIVFMLVLLLPHIDLSAQGCSMCTATAKSGSQTDDSLGEPLNIGILYLMAIPYLIIFIAFRKRIFAFFRELNGMYDKK